MGDQGQEAGRYQPRHVQHPDLDLLVKVGIRLIQKNSV